MLMGDGVDLLLLLWLWSGSGSGSGNMLNENYYTIRETGGKSDSARMSANDWLLLAGNRLRMSNGAPAWTCSWSPCFNVAVRRECWKSCMDMLGSNVSCVGMRSSWDCNCVTKQSTRDIQIDQISGSCDFAQLRSLNGTHQFICFHTDRVLANSIAQEPSCGTATVLSHSPEYS